MLGAPGPTPATQRGPRALGPQGETGRRNVESIHKKGRKEFIYRAIDSSLIPPHGGWALGGAERHSVERGRSKSKHSSGW